MRMAAVVSVLMEALMRTRDILTTPLNHRADDAHVVASKWLNLLESATVSH